VVDRLDDVQSELSVTLHGEAPRRVSGRRLARLAFGALVSVAALAGGQAACSGHEGADSSRDNFAESNVGAQPASGGVVDSAIPIAEALRRFRVAAPEVRALAGGARSREALVARFVASLEAGDTTALRAMELTKSEFAWLVYPSSIYTRPPYEQQPGIVWMLSRSAGERGYRRLVERYAGRRLGYQDYACDESPVVQGTNTTWRDCRMHYRRDVGDVVRGRLFGAIVERGGVFKFVNYSNDL
jgi:hypothetical protein